MQDVNKDDICRFADDFLDKDLKLKGKILRETRNYIAENAQGVFVWVALIKTNYCVMLNLDIVVPKSFGN